MDDKEIIVVALREYERNAEFCAQRLPRDQHACDLWRKRADDAVRIRAELEDNFEYTVRGGTS